MERHQLRHGVSLADAARIVKLRNCYSDPIYEWIVENTFRDPKVRGCGVGDIRSMLETGNLGGKCADLNALFVGLARAVGVPARDVYGIRVADSAEFKTLGKSGDITKAQHCRAEFYSASLGWVPVDPADVRKVVLEERGGIPLDDPTTRRARAKLFGQWEMNCSTATRKLTRSSVPEPSEPHPIPLPRGRRFLFSVHHDCRPSSSVTASGLRP
jgi:hypothetical protein